MDTTIPTIFRAPLPLLAKKIGTFQRSKRVLDLTGNRNQTKKPNDFWSEW